MACEIHKVLNDFGELEANLRVLLATISPIKAILFSLKMAHCELYRLFAFQYHQKSRVEYDLFLQDS